jgi:hypothetical protein
MRGTIKVLSSSGEQREKRNENNRAITPLNLDPVVHLAPNGRTRQEKTYPLPRHIRSGLSYMPINTQTV